MYIRWIVRGHKNEEVADVTFHDAYLVESYRDDAGRPRQRTISYLGNIRQIGERFPGIERELFLLRAELILGGIAELSDADRKDVLQQLQQRVPPLTEGEVREAFEGNLRWYFRWWQDNGGTPSADEILQMIRNAAQSAGSISL
ncbi:MAG: hypothetical protein GYB67_06170 [Chloroflexi bacterium]|nr:hypothetical protein [Chloroflexota bacterium]